MSYPVNYAYYPMGDHGNTWELIWNRHKSIEYAWRAGVKGVPIPFTGGKQWRKSDERQFEAMSYRRDLDAQWLSDWIDEGYDIEDGFSVSEWFGDVEDYDEWEEIECPFCHGPCEL